MTDTTTITGRECRFAIHIPTYQSDIPDIHLVKEAVHYSDGTVRPNIKLWKNFKRPYWITKPQYRNHTQKKESEDLDRLMRFEATQSDLARSIAQSLGVYSKRPMMKQLSASPYLYGSDIASTSIIKHMYQTKYPEAKSSFTVGYFDIETDVLHGTEDPILVTFVFEKLIYQVAVKSFFKGFAEDHIEDRLRFKIEEHLGEHFRSDKYLKKVLKEDDFDIQIVLVDDTVTLIKTVMAKVHEQSPDFLAIWNMVFDVPKLLDTLKKYGADAKDVFSHPTLPPELRFCKYKKGSTKKVTASGGVKPKNPSEQWHSLYCPAGFYIIDAMCSFRFVRQGEQELPYYKLDFVMERELGIRKLNFKEAEGLSDLDWHEFMQEKYPFEYAVYNIFDCIGMMELEIKNDDLSQKVPVMNKTTDFSRFNSQTKRFADGFHFFMLEKGGVASTIPPMEEKEGIIADDDPDEEEDEEPQYPDDEEVDPYQEAMAKDDVLSLRNWIVTLPAHLSALGRRLIKESPTVRTLIRTHTYDSDAVSAYPSCTAVANVSKATTVREIIDIVGIPEEMFRRQNINLLQGHVNALEYATTMFNLPTPQEALALFADM